MRLRILSGLLLLIAQLGLYAQTMTSSIHEIEEVVTYGDYTKFQSGAKIETISSKQMTIAQEGGIEQLLMRYTPIYVKTNAGGLSTISIRGTAPDHTSIMFGGINVNSLTLGHSNLSNITSFLFDKMELQYGSSAALNGSGAIGGAIYLGQRNYWTNGVKADFKLTAGSFGERLYGTKVYIGNGKFESVTKILKYKTDNNFPFKNPYHNKRISHPEPMDDIQKGAAINNKGFIQEFNYLFGANEFFKSMFWYEDSWHQIQPNMQQNFTYTDTQELCNNNFRFWTEYTNENNKFKYNLGGGYVLDKQLYADDSTQIIQTDRLITDFSFKNPIGQKAELKAGVKFKHIVPTVYSYSDSLISYEQHLDLYTALFFRPSKRLKTTINLRQQFVTNYRVPFTPALGIDYQILSSSTSRLNGTFNASRSYRVPTFNDRFWGTQGDPNLAPEDGTSLELGLTYRLNKENFNSKLQVNTFYMDIENWIEWRNKGVWVPFNLERVITKGIEVVFNASMKTGKFISDISANYTYNPAIKTEKGSLTQQLIYKPKNMANMSYMLNYNSLTFFIDANYTGSRFYEYTVNEEELANREYLEGYFLLNTGIKYDFDIKKQHFNCSFSANNILNTNYQNQRYYAMPGINFKASIVAKINFINNNN